jgi:photosystem II stability/assembly factor-like uncharacterized protein
VWVAFSLVLAWAAAMTMLMCVAGSQDVGAGNSASAISEASLGRLAHWQAYSEGLPTYAMVVAVAFDPTDPAVIYAGTYEPAGLWRSDDRGRSWQVDDAGLGGSPVYTIRWDAIRRLWWVGTRDGLYARGAEAGSPRPDWQVMGLPGQVVYAIAEDEKGRLYAGTEEGLFRSGDGASWKMMRVPDGQTDTTILALDVSPDGRTLLTGTAGQGLWISHDNGDSWSVSANPATEAGEALTQADVSTILFDPRPGGVAYASTSERAYRSDDKGLTWQPINVLDGRVHAFAFGADGSTYAALAGQVARSSDGGRTWEWHETGLRPGDRVLDLAVSAKDSAFVCAAAWDGLYVSTDRGQNWARRSDGPGYPDVNALAWDGSGNLLAGTRSGLFRRALAGAAWQAVPDLQGRPVLTVAVGTGSPRPYYAGCSGGLFRSTDGGRTWAEVRSELSDDGIAGLIVDPADPDHLHAWVAFGRVHESRDGGRNWMARWEGLGDVRPVTAIHCTQGGQFYVGAEDGIFRWEATRQTWELLPLPLVAPTVFVVETDGRDVRTVYAGATDGIWRSPDGGQTWHRWGAGLAGVTVTALALRPTDDRIAFAGTRHQGLYATTDGGATWQPAWEGRLATASVRDILFGRDGQAVYVASDQGIWQGKADDAR